MHYYYLILYFTSWCFLWQVCSLSRFEADLLSPFLFILGSEILSSLILREENLGSLHGIKMASMCPPISHLLFANDVMIFSRANVREANVIDSQLSFYLFEMV